MKFTKTLSISVIAFVGILICDPTNAQAPAFLNNGLVAHYPFNGNANDASGNTHNGVTRNTAYGVDRFGITGKSLAFNGTTSELSANDSLLDLGQNYAISLWFKFNNALPVVYDPQPLVASFQRNWGMAFSYNDTPSTPPRVISWAVGTGAGSWTVGYIHGNKNDYVSGRWYHLVFKKELHEYKMFINGALESALTVNNDFSFWTGFEFGFLSSSPTYLDGSLDDIRIYNRALSSSEVSALYAYESTPPNPDITSGLVAYYPFNGNANDASGNGNNGTVKGATITTDRFGKPNSSYSFNGLTDYIGIPDAPSLNPTSFISVSAWVNPTKITKINESFGIVSKFASNDSMKGQWVLWQGNVDTGSGVQPGFRGYVAGTGQVGNGQANFATQQADGRWHHLTMTYDGVNVLLYKDGKVVASDPFVGKIEVFAQAVEIGRWYHGLNNGGNNYYYSGGIDDVRIYNRALSASEVSALYQFESQPPSTLSFTNRTPIASYFIDLSHYNKFQTPVLNANTTYCFRASGRGGVGPLDRGDAMADAAFYPSFRPLTAATGNPANTWEWVGHTPFRPTPDVFATDHVYYFYFQGNNTNETLIFQDNPYTDNVGGFNVDLFLVSVPQPTISSPTIVSQPQSQSVVSGNSVTFTVTGTGSSTLSYQWRKNGVNIPGATFGTYTINNVQSADSASYSVVVSNSAGAVVSDAATLAVLTPPTILVHPQSQSVSTGGSVTFGVTSTTGSLTLTYQWIKKGVNILGATLSNFTISNVQDADAGTYSVAVSNAAGVVVSDVATLTVLKPPAITVQPQSQIGVVGSAVTFTVTGTGSLVLTYQWRKNGVNISGATARTYTINNVQSADAGTGLYSVVVSNSAGAVASNAVTLTVLNPPLITLQPQSQSVAIGGAGTFVVTATGTSPVTYQWRKNGVNIPGATSSSYTIANVQNDAAASYSVVVSNAAGTVVSNAGTLTVLNPPTFLVQPQSQNVVVGGPVTFAVTVTTGSLGVTYQWRKDGVNILSAAFSSYTINSAQTADTGSYSVVVSNAAGTVASDIATLTVVTSVPTPLVNAFSLPRLSFGKTQGFRIPFSPPDRSPFKIETSIDLKTWTPLISFPTNSGPFEFIDSTAIFFTNRFYRAIALTSSPTTDTPANPNPQNFVWIKPGTFTMGSPNVERERFDVETQHTVTISHDFYMSKYEVTQREYLAVMGINTSYFTTKDSKGKAITPDLNRPVEQVSWYDATNYCGMLTVSERAAGRLAAGWVYRLPTEAEWEYACRGGTTTVFHYGNALRSGMANFNGGSEYVGGAGTLENPDGTHLARTTAVGSYAPNGFGLYDMHGNVSEWCLDLDGGYPVGSVTDPKGPPSGSNRVIRGGGWNNIAGACRSANRSSRIPSNWTIIVGFRPVLAPGQ